MMEFMGIHGIFRLLQAVIIAPALIPGFSIAQDSPTHASSMRGEDASHAMVIGNQFNVMRTLDDYGQILSSERNGRGGDSAFRKALLNLKPEDTWLEFGCGDCDAVSNYIRNYSHGAKVRAITFKLTDEARAQHLRELQPRLQLIAGRFIEHIPKAEIGRAKLATDVYGPFTYSAMPDIVLRKYLDALEDDGDLFLVGGYDSEASRSHVDPLAGPEAMNEAVARSERPVLVDWLLAHTKGITFSKIVAPGTYGESKTSYHIRKTGEEIRIPRLMMKSFTPGSPEDPVPYRAYSPAGRSVTDADIAEIEARERRPRSAGSAP